MTIVWRILAVLAFLATMSAILNLTESLNLGIPPRSVDVYVVSSAAVLYYLGRLNEYIEKKSVA